MGKAVAYLIVAVIGVLLLRSTGLFDGMFSRGNLEERDASWQKTLATEVLAGISKAAVEALAARHNVPLDCFDTSLAPPVTYAVATTRTPRGGLRVIR